MDTLVNLQFLVDDAKCFDTVRRLRWPEGVRCTQCGSDKVARDGHDDRQPERQRYRCTACQGRFDDLTRYFSLNFGLWISHYAVSHPQEALSNGEGTGHQHESSLAKPRAV